MKQKIGHVNLEVEMCELINEQCGENVSNTPDFILAEFMQNALNAFNKATNQREEWYGNGAEDQIYAALDAEILKRQRLEDELDQAYGRMDDMLKHLQLSDFGKYYRYTMSQVFDWFDSNGKANRGVK